MAKFTTRRQSVNFWLFRFNWQITCYFVIVRLKPKISRKALFQIMLLPKVVLIFHVNRLEGPTAVVNALLSVLRFSFDRIMLIVSVIFYSEFISRSSHIDGDRRGHVGFALQSKKKIIL